MTQIPDYAQDPTDLYSLVHTQSTSAIVPQASYRDKLLDRCSSEYQAVFDAYSTFASTRLLERLENCRTRARFTQHIPTGIVKVASTSCHVKGCPLCAAGKSAWLTKRLSAEFSNTPDLKFMTLTLKHDDQPLYSKIREITKNFRNFRNNKYLKSHVKGGFWSLELKKGNDDLWHVHLHTIIQADFMPQKLLSEIWEKVTGTSKIVDIRQVKNPDVAAKYCAKYVTKPCEVRFLKRDEAVEFLAATRNVRTFGLWGTFKKANLLKKEPYIASDWKNLGNYFSVMNLRHTEPVARDIYAAWQSQKPCEPLEGLDDWRGDICETCGIPPNPVNRNFETPWLF